MVQTAADYTPGTVREDILDDLFYHSTDDVPLYMRVAQSVAKRERHQWRARIRRARGINKNVDGAAWGADPVHPDAVPLENATQILREKVRVSGRAEEIAMVGVEDIFNEESENALEIIGTDLEHSLFNGTRDFAEPQEMGGIRDRAAWGSLSALAGTFQMNELNTGAAGAGLTKTHIRTIQQAAYNDGEQMDCLLVEPNGKFDVAGLSSDTRVTNQDEDARKFVDGIDIYWGDLGKFEVVLTRDMPADEAIGITKRYLRVAWLRRLRWEKPSKEGDSRRGWWLMEATLEVLKPWSMGLIFNISR